VRFLEGRTELIAGADNKVVGNFVTPTEPEQ
jgi:hypothetical protein